MSEVGNLKIISIQNGSVKEVKQRKKTKELVICFAYIFIKTKQNQLP